MLDDKASAELFRMYSKRLYNTALRITRSEDEAEEVMQEALIRYITGNVDETLHEGRDGHKKAWAWLRTVAVRLSIDCLRHRKRFVRLDDPVEGLSDAEALEHLAGQDDEAGFWDSLDGNIMGMVMEEIGRLPDGYRIVLMLRLVEEYDYGEIAEALSISEAGARSQFMRGRRKVAERIRLRMKEESEG